MIPDPELGTVCRIYCNSCKDELSRNGIRVY